MLHTNAFRYGLTASIADTAIAPVLTAARWGVIAWDTAYTLATHRRTVKAIKLAVWGIYIAAIITYSLGQVARIYTQSWVNAQISSALPQPVDHIADAGKMVDPFCPTMNPLPKPVAPKPPTTAQLRRECIAYNATLPARDPRRIARAARLTKAQALAALGRV